MTVETIDAIRGAQQRREQDAEAAYRNLVLDVADCSPEQADAILVAAGKTADDLAADLERLAAFRADRELVATEPEARSESERLAGEIEEADRDIAKYERELRMVELSLNAARLRKNNATHHQQQYRHTVLAEIGWARDRLLNASQYAMFRAPEISDAAHTIDEAERRKTEAHDQRNAADEELKAARRRHQAVSVQLEDARYKMQVANESRKSLHADALADYQERLDVLPEYVERAQRQVEEAEQRQAEAEQGVQEAEAALQEARQRAAAAIKP
ncbi:MAG: hypothetical protein RIC55_12655 [Pirellulaceae bacterium]